MGTKVTVSLVVDGFGSFTTALLQWFVSPYVLRMRLVDDHTVAVEKLTLFARVFEDRFPIAVGNRVRMRMRFRFFPHLDERDGRNLW